MAIVSHRLRIVFFPMPKNCSSSVKSAFYKLETGMTYRRAKKKFGLTVNVHSCYRVPNHEKWKGIYDSYDTVTFVREPIKRFLSAYSNRVVHVRALEKFGTSPEEISEAGYPVRPTLEEFAEHLEYYCSVSSHVRKHVNPQEKIIGDIFPKIKHVFDTSQIPEFEKLVTERDGRPFTLPHNQTGGKKYKFSDLSDGAMEKLTKFYAADYKMLSSIYQKP
jgi:hypothetical protein